MYSNMPFMMPNMAGAASSTPNLLGGLSLFKKINWSSILTHTHKVLSVANQAIPLYYQTKPIIQNIKSLGKITKEFNNTQKSNNINSKVNSQKTNSNLQENLNNNIPKPTFFI